MNHRDDVGLLQEQLSRFRVNGGSPAAGESGYGRIMAKDAQGRSLSSGSMQSDPGHVYGHKAYRSLPGSNLTSPSRAQALPTSDFYG